MKTSGKQQVAENAPRTEGDKPLDSETRGNGKAPRKAVAGKPAVGASPRRPTPKPRSVSAARRSGPRGRSLRGRLRFAENLRLVVSLALLGFLGYYGYQRVAHDRDILHPLRIRIYREVIPACRAAAAGLRARIHDLLPFDFEAPRTTSGKPGPPAVAEAVSEFTALLHKCEEEMPQVGDTIGVRMKGRDEEIKGTVERIGISGVILRVEHGTMVCPFVVMEEECRLMFFPEERARILWKQREIE